MGLPKHTMTLDHNFPRGPDANSWGEAKLWQLERGKAGDSPDSDPTQRGIDEIISYFLAQTVQQAQTSQYVCILDFLLKGLRNMFQIQWLLFHEVKA